MASADLAVTVAFISGLLEDHKPMCYAFMAEAEFGLMRCEGTFKDRTRLLPDENFAGGNNAIINAVIDSIKAFYGASGAIQTRARRSGSQTVA